MTRACAAIAMMVVLGSTTTVHAQAATPDLFGKKTTEFYDAMKKKDAAGLGAVLADDVAYTAATGDVLGTKAAYIDALTKYLTVESYALKPVLVHIYGDTAVAVYRVSLKAMAGTNPWNPDLSATDTWVKIGGTWKMVAHHVSPLLKR